MKIITKICFILSMALLLLGVAGIGVGALMGVTPSRLINEGRYPGRLCRLPKLEVDVPDSIPSLSGNNPTQSEEYYEFGDIENLELDLGLCELQFHTHSEDHIAVCADNTKDYFTCRQSKDTLILKDDRPTLTISDSMKNALILDIYLPEQEYDEIDIDMGAGNITLDLLSADSFKIDNGAGNVTMHTLTCEDLAVNTGVGELQADSLQVSDTADIEIGTGNITIAQFAGENLNLDCGVGNAQVTADGREEDYDYKVQSGIGSVCLNHQTQEYTGHHYGFHHEDSSCIESRKGVGRQLSIVCGMGTAELNFSE